MLVLSMVVVSFLWILVTFQSVVPDLITETPLYGEIVTALQPYLGADPEASSLTRLMVRLLSLCIRVSLQYTHTHFFSPSQSFIKFIGTFMIFTFMARFVGSRANGYPTLSGKEMARLADIQKWVTSAGNEKCDAIWNKFTGDVDGKKD